MSRKKRNTLQRKIGHRPYKSICWIATEGNTEREYFRMVVFQGRDILIKFPPNPHPEQSSPVGVLKRLKKEIQKDFREGDAAWIVIDTDNWSDDQLAPLKEWADNDPHYHLAVSNPKFELFLLMHFESGSGCTTSAKIDARLKRHMPDYDKHLSATQFNANDVKVAMKNARAKRRSCTDGLPRPGMTDVYRLVESLLGEYSTKEERK